MIEDKISLALKELTELKDKLKGVKKDIKTEEKIEDPDYIELKAALKDLKKQVKDFEEEWNEKLNEDDFYNKLRELKVQTEEQIANQNEKLFKLIDELPQKFVQMDVETENGNLRIQIQPEMKLYLNGREERKRKM